MEHAHKSESFEAGSVEMFGSLEGHLLTGTFFIILGLWWAIHIYHRYFTCLKRNVQFMSTATFTYTRPCGKKNDWPLEAAFKLLVAISGISFQTHKGFSITPELFSIIYNGSFVTIFFFLGLSALIDLLLFCKVPLPSGIDYGFGLIALVVEVLLFHIHIGEHEAFVIRVYILLKIAIILGMAAVILEMLYRHNVLSALFRTFSILLQGTWFWHVAFILYNPNQDAEKWKAHNHDQMMLVTVFFTWHCGSIFILLLFLCAFVAGFHGITTIKDKIDVSEKLLGRNEKE